MKFIIIFVLTNASLILAQEFDWQNNQIRIGERVMPFYQIPSFPRFEINKEGIIREIKTLRVKSQYIGSQGYYMACFKVGSRSKPRRVHRILAQTFIPNPKNLPQVNHIDGNKLNNNIKNLEWVTNRENMHHAFRTGLINNTGGNNGMCKLNETDVKKIKQLLAEGISQEKISKIIGKVSRSAILKIHLGKTWQHIK